MSEVQGLVDVLEISSNGGSTWKTIVCETQNSFQFTRNSTSVTSKCNSGAPTTVLGGYTWSFQGSYNVESAPTSSQVSYKDLLNWSVGGTSLLIRNQNPSTGLVYYHYGAVYITDLQKTAEVDGIVTCQVTFSGNGELDYTP